MNYDSASNDLFINISFLIFLALTAWALWSVFRLGGDRPESSGPPEPGGVGDGGLRVCPACQGSGRAWEGHGAECPLCRGSRRVTD